MFELSDAAVAGAVNAARETYAKSQGAAWAEGAIAMQGAEGVQAATLDAALGSIGESSLVAAGAAAAVPIVPIAIGVAAVGFEAVLGYSAVATYVEKPALANMTSLIVKINTDFTNIQEEVAALEERLAGVANHVHSICEQDHQTKREMIDYAWLALVSCTTAITNIHADLTHALSDVTEAEANRVIAHKEWEACFVFCGDEPMTQLPSGAVQKVMTMQQELDDAEDALLEVGACSRGNICTPGAMLKSFSEMKLHMNKFTEIAHAFMANSTDFREPSEGRAAEWFFGFSALSTAVALICICLRRS